MKSFFALCLMLFTLTGWAYEDKYSTAGWWDTETYNAFVTVNRNEELIATYSGPLFKVNPNSWSFWVITPEIRNTPDGARFTVDFSFDGGQRYTYNAGIIHTGNGVINVNNNPEKKVNELAKLLQSHDSVTVYVNTTAEAYSYTNSTQGRQLMHSGTVTQEKPYTFSLKGSKQAMDKAKAHAIAWKPDNS